MELLNLTWKSNLFSQLKEQNSRRYGYEDLIEHYNRLLDSNGFLQNHCQTLEKENNVLRLVNANLEKSSGASEELTVVNLKLQATTEELMKNLRQNFVLAQDILQLNHLKDELNDKLLKEEAQVRQYQTENEELRHKLKQTEFELQDEIQTKKAVQDEFEALKLQLNPLLLEYHGLKPKCRELEQQLESYQLKNKQFEDEIVRLKNQLGEIHDLENERANRNILIRNSPETNQFMGYELIDIPPNRNSVPSVLTNTAVSQSSHDSMDSSLIEESFHHHGRRPTKGRVFDSIFRKLNIGNDQSIHDRLHRTSISCAFASIPTTEVAHWDCTDLEVYALQFQPSGSILATGCSDRMVHLWEISSNGQYRKQCSLRGSEGAINALDFDNEQYRLLVGASGGKAFLWSHSERILKETLTGHQGLIYTCKFVSGSKLCTGSADRTIRTWDLIARQCTRTLFTNSKCYDLVITDAVGSMVSAHHDGRLRFWDVNTDRFRDEVVFDSPITSLAFDKDRQQILACFKNDIIRLIDIRQNKTLLELSHENFQVRTDTNKVIFSPDGRYICSGSHDGSIVIWCADTGACKQVLQCKHKSLVTSVAWHPNGKYVASCEKHRRVILWGDR